MNGSRWEVLSTSEKLKLCESPSKAWKLRSFCYASSGPNPQSGCEEQTIELSLSRWQFGTNRNIYRVFCTYWHMGATFVALSDNNTHGPLSGHALPSQVRALACRKWTENCINPVIVFFGCAKSLTNQLPCRKMHICERWRTGTDPSFLRRPL